MTSEQAAHERRAAIAYLLMQVGRLVHSQSFAEGLNPAQWNALRYLGSANESACTVTAFAKHHLTSKGTASETFRALVAKGLVRRGTDAEDGRVRTFVVTAAGRRLVARDPLHALVDALEPVAPDDLAATARVIEAIIRGYRVPDEP